MGYYSYKIYENVSIRQPPHASSLKLFCHPLANELDHCAVFSLYFIQSRGKKIRTTEICTIFTRSIIQNSAFFSNFFIIIVLRNTSYFIRSWIAQWSACCYVGCLKSILLEYSSQALCGCYAIDFVRLLLITLGLFEP